MSRRRRTLSILSVAVAAALVVAAVGLWWYSRPSGPEGEALAALESDDTVEVSTEPWLVFKPRETEPTTGLILYPGAKVDPRSYAPAAGALAERGHLVVIPSMPLSLAVLAPNRAAGIQEAFPDIDRWAVGGHSLGGAMAAQYARGQPDAVSGLVLWGAYPSGSTDLSESGLAAASIYGTRDGLTTLENIEASRRLLPADTDWWPIDGGNHAGFGYYGEQSGDLSATIPRGEQQRQIVEATDGLLRRLGEDSG